MQGCYKLPDEALCTFFTSLPPPLPTSCSVLQTTTNFSIPLTKLDLAYNNVPISYKLLEIITTKLSNLKSLSLAYVQGFGLPPPSPSTATTTTFTSNTIEKTNECNESKKIDEGDGPLSSTLSLLTKLPLNQITHLNLSGLEIDNELLHGILERVGTSIQELILDNVTALTDDCCFSLHEVLFNGRKNLQVLSLKECYSISGNGVLSLFSSFAYSEEKEMNLQQHHDNFTKGYNYNNDNDESFSQYDTNKERTTGLESITLSYGDIHDLAVITLLQACRESLRSLTLNSCNHISDLSLVAVSHLASQTIETLDFSFCRKLTNRGLVYLCNSCPKLSLLNLFGCSQVDGKFLNGHANESVLVEGPLNLVKQKVAIGRQQ